MSDEDKHPNEQVASVKGDGLQDSKSADEKRIKIFLSEISEIYSDNAQGVHAARREAELARFCHWEGQAPDGRKHAQYLGVEKSNVFPFEGAPDIRCRLTDAYTSYCVALAVRATMQAIDGMQGVEASDAQAAGVAGIIMRYVVRNRIGLHNFRREIKKAANFYFGDSPAAVSIYVGWDREYGLRPVEVTMDDIGEFLLNNYSEGMQEAWQDSPALQGEELETFYQEVADYFRDPANEEQAIDLLDTLMPNQTPQRLRKALRQLRSGGAAMFPERFDAVDEPCVEAERVFEDIWMPIDTIDTAQRARVQLKQEWLTETELDARIDSRGYDAKWVEAVKEQKGNSAFPEFFTERWNTHAIRDYEIGHVDRHKDDYEVVTATFWATDEETKTRHLRHMPFNAGVDFPAHPSAILDTPDNEYPRVWMQREVLSSNIYDSRGIPELLGSEQNLLKALTDLQGAHAQIAQIPPIDEHASNAQTRTNKVISPLVRNPYRVEKDTFMTVPEGPRSLNEFKAFVKAGMEEYIGYPSDTSPVAVVQVLQQEMVDDWLGGIQELMVKLFRYTMSEMQPEELERITGMPYDTLEDLLPTSKWELKNLFDLSFDVNLMDPEYLDSMADFFAKVGSLDRQQTFNWAGAVGYLVTAKVPTIAPKLLRSTQEAQQSEYSTEQNLIAQIAAGIEPPMRPGEEDHQTRLQAWEDASANEEFMANWTQKSREIAEARIQYHQGQIEQYTVNAQAGRAQAAPAVKQG